MPIISILFSGLIIGLTLGLFGSGGSILALPFLTLVVGMDLREAIPTSLAAVGAVALWGVIQNIRHGTAGCDRASALFAVISCIGTALGVHLNPLFPDRVLLILFAGVVVVSAAKMVLSTRQQDRGGVRATPSTAPKALLILPLGLGTGFLSGLLGVGGGFLVVPALVLLLSLPISKAASVSLLVIALKALVGVSTYALQGRFADPHVLLLFLAGGAVGMFFGQRGLHRLPEMALRRGFAALLVFMSLLLLLQ